jgi:hypothetical protein
LVLSSYVYTHIDLVSDSMMLLIIVDED